MDAFDRVYSALKGHYVDRPPILSQIGDHAGFINHIPYYTMYKDAKKAALAHLNALRLYGYDITTIQVEPSWPVAEACGAKVNYSLDKNPWITTYLINSDKDLEALEMPNFLATESSRVMIEGTNLLVDEANVPIAAFMTGPLTFSLQLMPYKRLIIKLVKDHDFTNKLVEYSVKVIKAYIKLLKQAGATILVLCEHDYQILKPELIKTYSLKFLKEIFEIYKYNILHICGNVSPLLQDLAFELKQLKKLNMISIGHLVDISNTLKIFSPKIGVAGNIDHVKLLPHGSPKEIERAVENAINASGGTYRYMVAPGCEITADTPIENVKALVNATKKNSY
jgi:uroporphyrinogen decarboxylase